MIVAIDPGNSASAYVVIDDWCQPITFGKAPNYFVRTWLVNTVARYSDAATYAVEMVASYGMPVGRDVFETCVWIGRFAETIDSGRDGNAVARLVYRADVKMHLCHTTKAKDANITQALVDRFAAGEPNRGKGTKAKPGWFYGFAADVWQAYALAVTVADQQAANRS